MTATPHLPRFTFRLWLGWILLVMGITWTCVGLAILAFPSEKAGRDAGTFNALLGLAALVLPGFVLVGSARRDRRRVERVQRVAALASVASRLPFGQVAEDLGTDVATARKVLFDAVSFGVLSGRIDLERGVFVSGQPGVASTGERDVVCPGCGARSSVVVVPGLPTSCPFCGAGVA